MKNLKALCVLFIFLFTTLTPPNGWSQALDSRAKSPFITAVGLMPSPGRAISLSAGFDLAYFKGMVIDAHDPFKFDFIIHQSDERLSVGQKQAEYSKLIKYFLAALAVPDTDQWVNLSPYEHNRIISVDFGKTAMGRDLLAQDYLLKQLSSSLTNPDTSLGRKFWEKVYERVYHEFGTRNVPLNTFNKVWIVPDKATLYEKGNMVYVTSSHLKVMTEQDYLSIKKHQQSQANDVKTKAIGITNQVMRSIIIPAIEEEVNTGKNFAPLRQVLSGMLLATWYKNVLKESILAKVYADKKKIRGVDQDPKVNEKIFQQYLKAYKKGVYNLIKEETDPVTQEVIPRKYFSGGSRNTWGVNGAMVHGTLEDADNDFAQVSDKLDDARVQVDELKGRVTKAFLGAVVVGFMLQHSTPASAQQNNINAAPTNTTLFAWNPSPDPTVSGYNFLEGTSAGVYTSDTDVGLASTITISNLPAGFTYHFAVAAHNAYGLEGGPSSEVLITVSNIQTVSPNVIDGALQPQTIQVPNISAGIPVNFNITGNINAITDYSYDPSNGQFTFTPLNENAQVNASFFDASGTNGTQMTLNISQRPAHNNIQTAVNIDGTPGAQTMIISGIPTNNVVKSITSSTGQISNQAFDPTTGTFTYTAANQYVQDTETILFTDGSTYSINLVTHVIPNVVFSQPVVQTFSGMQFVTLQATAPNMNPGDQATENIYTSSDMVTWKMIGQMNVSTLPGTFYYPSDEPQAFFKGVWVNTNSVNGDLNTGFIPTSSSNVRNLAVNKTPVSGSPHSKIDNNLLASSEKPILMKGGLKNLNPLKHYVMPHLLKGSQYLMASLKDLKSLKGSKGPSGPVIYVNGKVVPSKVIQQPEISPGLEAALAKETGKPKRESLITKGSHGKEKEVEVSYGDRSSKGNNNSAMTNGGIDFAQSNLEMQIKRDGKGMVLPISQQDLENIHIDGLVPTILNIKRVPSELLFGRNMEESSMTVANS